MARSSASCGVRMTQIGRSNPAVGGTQNNSPRQNPERRVDGQILTREHRYVEFPEPYHSLPISGWRKKMKAHPNSYATRGVRAGLQNRRKWRLVCREDQHPLGKAIPTTRDRITRPLPTLRVARGK